MEIVSENLKINGESPFISITKFEIVKELQNHAVLNVEGVLSFEKNSDFKPLNWLKKEISALFCDTLKPKDGDYVFFGEIVDVSIINSGKNLFCKLKGKSLSYKMDLNRKTRFFQDTNKTYKDVIDIISKDYKSDIKIKHDSSITGKKLDSLIIQYDETDWSFLQRVCRKLGSILFITSESSSQEIYFKSQGKEKLETDFYEINLSLNNEEIFFETTSGQLYDIGDKLSIFNKSYLISKIIHRLEGGVIKSQYSLKEKNLNSTDGGNYNIVSLSLKAKVKTDKDEESKGRVKTQFDGDDIWPNSFYIPVSTPYSSNENSGGVGFFSIPEIDESVFVYFPSEKEEDCFISSVLRDKKDQKIENPTHKIWRNRKGREFKITDETISISSKDNEIFINLDDTKIELKNKTTSIILKESEIVVKHEKNEITLDKDHIVLQSGASIINIKDDSISFKSSKISIDGKTEIKGDTSIKGKTKIN